MIFRSLGDVAPEPISHNDAILKQVLLRRGDVDGVFQFAVAEFPAGEVAGAHAHDGIVELFLCTAGSGTLTLDGVGRPVVEGDFFVCQPGEVHEIAASTDLRFTVVALRA